MFYGIYPPWAGFLIALSIASGITFIITVCVVLYTGYLKRPHWLTGIPAFVVMAASIVGASVQAYNSQIDLYNLSVKQQLSHVDSLNGVTGGLHIYNSSGNCFVYAKYDSYQKAAILDSNQIHRQSVSLSGSTVYGLTTRPLTQEGVNKLCDANYGQNAFNNSTDDN